MTIQNSLHCYHQLSHESPLNGIYIISMTYNSSGTAHMKHNIETKNKINELQNRHWKERKKMEKKENTHGVTIQIHTMAF